MDNIGAIIETDKVLRERRVPRLQMSEIMQELEKIQWLSADVDRVLEPQA